MAANLSKAMTASKMHSVAPRAKEKNICTAQPNNEILRSLDIVLNRSFGTMVEEKQISMMERLLRKKYMGVCNAGLILTARTRRKFPDIVTK